MEPCDNVTLLNIYNAMIGSVSPNWRAMFIKGDSHNISITFILASESDEDREEIDDVAFEFEAMQPDTNMSVHVVVDVRPIHELTGLGELIFARKE